MKRREGSEEESTVRPRDAGEDSLQRSELYPQYQHPFLRQLPGEADEFDLVRERLLEGYGYNTARAYWGDLEHWRDWCLEQVPAVEPVLPATANIEAYLDQMGEAGYSPSTRARRLTVLRAFFKAAHALNPEYSTAVESLSPLPRRKGDRLAPTVSEQTIL